MINGSRSRWSTSPASAPAADRWPRSIRSACCGSGRRVPAPILGRPATGPVTDATVTDANLILGYVPADYFLGGEMKLDEKASRRAMKPLMERLGLDAKGVAESIFRTVNANMANKITEVSTKRGYDIRDYVMIAGGGGGPIHAGFIADSLGIRKVVVPPVAALYSAFGMFAMDIGQDYARSFVSRAANTDLAALNRVYEEMEAEAHGVLPGAWRRCQGRRAQTHAPTCAMSANSTRSRSTSRTARLPARWSTPPPPPSRRKHEELYTFAMPWKAVEILTLRLKATTPNAPFALPQVEKGGDRSERRVQAPAHLPLQRTGRRYPGL